MTKKFVAALAQIRPVLGDVTANVEKHIAWIRRAKASSAELIVFPELGLTGYHVQDLTLDVARKMDDEDIQRVVAESLQGIDVVFSFIEETDQHLFHIACVYASQGEIKAVHRKVYLPTYGMFDEGRYFAPGREFRSFQTQFGTAGLMICEDAWHMSSPYLLAMDGANLLICPASSPARSVNDPEQFGSQKFWRDLVQVYARICGVNLIFVNRVGYEDGVNFFGGSCVVSAEGEWLGEAPILDEALTCVAIDGTSVRRARYATPILRDEKMDLVQRELSRMMTRPAGGVQA